MSKIIYVIIASGGQYNDAWETNLFAVSDEETAKSEVTGLSESHERLSEIYNQVNSYIYSFPHRSHNQIELPPKPKGPAVSTKELMKAYREQIEEWNKLCGPIIAENARLYHEYNLDMHQKVLNKLKEFDLSEEDYEALHFQRENKTRWYISYNTDKSFTYEELILY